MNLISYTTFQPYKSWPFHLTHVCILGKYHCGEMQRKYFKQRGLYKDVLCRCDYAKRVVASFANQIQSEYYGKNNPCT